MMVVVGHLILFYYRRSVGQLGLLRIGRVVHCADDLHLLCGVRSKTVKNLMARHTLCRKGAMREWPTLSADRMWSEWEVEEVSSARIRRSRRRRWRINSPESSHAVNVLKLSVQLSFYDDRSEKNRQAKKHNVHSTKEFMFLDTFLQERVACCWMDGDNSNWNWYLGPYHNLILLSYNNTWLKVNYLDIIKYKAHHDYSADDISVGGDL